MNVHGTNHEQTQTTAILARFTVNPVIVHLAFILLAYIGSVEARASVSRHSRLRVSIGLELGNRCQRLERERWIACSLSYREP